jgi:outer membrane protein assembly factor BamB
LYAAKRPFVRPVLFFFIIASLFLAACGVRPNNQNWPGLIAEGEILYVAHGPGIIAYNAQTQAQQWSFPATARANLFFFAQPFVEDGRLYFGDYGAPGGFFSPNVTVSIYALDSVDSPGAPRELWVNNAVAKDKIIGQPLLVDGRLFVGTADNYILALDAEDGVELWRVETGHSIWDQPAYRDGVLYVTSIDRIVYALDAQTGAERWRRQLNGALASRPVLNHNMLYVSSFDKQVHALDLATGDEIWAADANDWVWGAPTVADGAVYYADVKGNLFAVDAETGAPLWSAQTLGAVQTSPVVIGDTVYVASEGLTGDEVTRGALTAYAVTDGSQRWQMMTPAPLFTTPVVVDDVIIVALQSEAALLIGFDLETGAQRWLIAPP